MTTTSKTAEAIVEALQQNRVKPVHEYTAACGPDYGVVKAWEINDRGYVIEANDNASRIYDIYDSGYEPDDDDLAAYLIPDSMQGADRALIIAQIKGLDAIDDPSDDAQSLQVLVRHHLLSDNDNIGWLTDDGNEMVFTSVKDAQKCIDDLDAGQYCTSYKIVEV
jgi:hypothetical protein